DGQRARPSNGAEHASGPAGGPGGRAAYLPRGPGGAAQRPCPRPGDPCRGEPGRCRFDRCAGRPRRRPRPPAGVGQLARPRSTLRPAAGPRPGPRGWRPPRRHLREGPGHNGAPAGTHPVIRVVLVDDHAMVRAGLEQLLVAAGDIEVVGSVADGLTAVELVRRSRPDVVLMDISLPGLDGIRATAAIQAADPEVRVVMLTSFGDRVRVLAAVDAGAAGYILKEADPEDLLRAVRAAARGESPVSPRAGQALFAARTGRLDAADQLTSRERHGLPLVAEGLVNKQIARRLGIS